MTEVTLAKRGLGCTWLQTETSMTAVPAITWSLSMSRFTLLTLVFIPLLHLSLGSSLLRQNLSSLGHTAITKCVLFSYTKNTGLELPATD